MFDAARAHHLDSSFLRLNRYILAFLEKDSPAMKEEADSATGKSTYEDTILDAQADVETYYGRVAQARELQRQAKSATKTADIEEKAAEYDANAAWREAEIGNFALTRKHSAASLAHSNGSAVRAKIAMALARIGDVSQSEKIAAQLEAQYPRSTVVQSFTLPTIRALMEVSRNRPAQAIEILQPVIPYELGEQGFGNLQPAYVRGLAYLQLGKGTEAAAEFQKLINQPGVVGTFVTGALAHLQLGRSNQMMGNVDEARRHYQDFFALWKGADPDVPILKQAKAEYAKLQGARSN